MSCKGLLRCDSLWYHLRLYCDQEPPVISLCVAFDFVVTPVPNTLLTPKLNLGDFWPRLGSLCPFGVWSRGRTLLPHSKERGIETLHPIFFRHLSSMVEHVPRKDEMWVRFPNTRGGYFLSPPHILLGLARPFWIDGRSSLSLALPKNAIQGHLQQLRLALWPNG